LPPAARRTCEYVAVSSASTLAGGPERVTVAAGEEAGDTAGDGAAGFRETGPATAAVALSRPEEMGFIAPMLIS
jgi:hypothetical protein